MSLGFKTILLVAGIGLAGKTPVTAQNMVINGNFEDGNTCEEFHLPCGPAAWVTLPVNTKVVFYGTESKKDPNHHFGAVIENIKNPITGRTYVQTMLCQPLAAGQRYRFSMRCFTGPAPFEQAGVLIAGDEIIYGIDTLENLHSTFDITPDSVQHKTDLRKWVTVQYTFTAVGGEEFLLIGNFSKTYMPLKPEYTHDVFGDVVLSMDDISLVPETPVAGVDTGCQALRTRLYAQHLRHTPYIYLLGESRKTTTTPSTTVNKQPAMQTGPANIKVTIPQSTDNDSLHNDTLRIPFAVNSSLLEPKYTASLDSVLQLVLAQSFKNIVITGYTDNSGPKALNKALSYQRAHAVAGYFMAKGRIQSRVITISGRADEHPIAPNDTPEGRAQNRRVEVIVRR